MTVPDEGSPPPLLDVLAAEDAALDADLRELVGLSPEVQDDAAAAEYVDRLLRALGSFEAEQAEVKAAARRAVEEIADRWSEHATFLARRRECLLRWLQTAALSLTVFGGKKSRDLPHGTVGFRASRRRLEVVDEGVAMGFARNHVPIAIEVIRKEKLVVKELDAYFKQTGDVPDGCKAVGGGDNFYAKPQPPRPRTLGAFAPLGATVSIPSPVPAVDDSAPESSTVEEA